MAGDAERYEYLLKEIYMRELTPSIEITINNGVER